MKAFVPCCSCSEEKKTEENLLSVWEVARYYRYDLLYLTRHAIHIFEAILLNFFINKI